MAAQIPPAVLIRRFEPQLAKLGAWWRAASREAKAKGGRLRLTSWWRSKAKNEATSGSASASQHLAGTAIDVVGIDLATAKRLAEPLGLTAIASQRGAVHVQALPAGTVARLLAAEPGLFT